MKLYHHLHRAIYIALLLISGPLNAALDNIAATTKQELKTELNKLLVSANGSVGFNGTALLAINGEILFEDSIGSVGKKDKQPLTPKYAFSPGSITKEFSAIAIYMLVEEERLTLEQTIERFFPSLPDWTKEITVEHLMTHTSGLPDVSYVKNKTNEQALQDLRSVEVLKFQPGTEFYYGNNNTILRALIVERVTGKSFSEFIEERIFTPLQMTGSFTKQDFISENRKIALGAMPLALTGITAYTTAVDLFKLETALWSDNFLQSDFISKAIKKPSLGGDSRAYYDFGFYKSDANGALQSIEHDGTYPSHYALKHTNLQKDYTIVLLSNDGRKTTLNEIRKAIVDYLENGKLELPYTWEVKAKIKKNGLARTIEFIKVEIENGRFKLDEEQLNLLSYDYFYDGDTATALELLKMNWELHEDSLNAIDSYVEMSLNAGKFGDVEPLIQRGLAIAEVMESEFFRNRFVEFKKIVNEASH